MLQKFKIKYSENIKKIYEKEFVLSYLISVTKLCTNFCELLQIHNNRIELHHNLF